jgi:fatty-acyl-CoA synthase
MTIDRWIRNAAAHSPDKAAIIFDDQPLSYQQFTTAIDNAADWLSNRGLRKGDRLAYLGLNDPHIFVLLFACAKMGFVFVPLNWRLSASEILEILDDCQPRMMVHDQHFADVAKTVQQCPCEDLRTTKAQAASTKAGEHPSRVLPDDAVLLVYTSGSTGRPKGVLLSQSALDANAEMSIDAHQMKVTDRVVCVLPLFHVGGLNILATPAFRLGATVILHQMFDPAQCLQACAQAQLIIMVPTILKRLIDHQDWAAADLKKLRAISIGSTDVPIDLINAVHQRGVPVIQIYGATETAPIAIYQKIGEAFDSVGSIGRQGCACRIEIRRRDGQKADIGEAGAIWVHGKNTLLGYWQDQTLSAENIKAGWFYTGDVAYQDAAGLFWFVDRIKHVIISGGENIYPAEIERVLRSHAGIEEVAVIGQADPEWGCVPVAVIGGKSAPKDAEIRDFLNTHLARYKQPRQIYFVDALPRNAMGKIVTEDVRAMITNGSQSPQS